MEPFKVHISYDPMFAGIRMWFISRCVTKRFIAKPMALEWEDYNTTDPTQPEATLTLNHLESTPFVQAMASALSEYGIKPDNEHKVHGLYEAQSHHLKDLRHMLKLPKE